ncbi:Hypothetical predicted protein [Octopus vulgaris]|uniref:Uncharacterized protein n=1 Tax=Octopus vulgaris TaxID=6645 RepID=A0AA36AWT4_OCTVU|nr:Hypothetical predicted protein [Octopus vulgaris]
MDTSSHVFIEKANSICYLWDHRNRIEFLNLSSSRLQTYFPFVARLQTTPSEEQDGFGEEEPDTEKACESMEGCDKKSLQTVYHQTSSYCDIRFDLTKTTSMTVAICS